MTKSLFHKILLFDKLSENVDLNLAKYENRVEINRPILFSV